MKNNIRTLLCTLHNILWSGCEWKPVSMGDVISLDGVKSKYKLAITMFHPDKVQGLSDQHKRYIADRVFNALSDAFKEFKVFLHEIDNLTNRRVKIKLFYLLNLIK